MGDIRFIVMAALLAACGVFTLLRPDRAKSRTYDHPLNQSPLWLIRALGAALIAVSLLFIRQYLHAR
jgi:hypothetical protein